MIDCLTAQEQVLCIVNSRNLAQELFEEIPREGAFCLTTLLHPEPRKEKLREIKERLEHHVPCRVIATSLVEAGVDLDFPCVYRQENGLDALIQAAGRCNREGTHSPEESKDISVRFERRCIGIFCTEHQRVKADPALLRRSGSARRRSHSILSSIVRFWGERIWIKRR